MNTLYVFGYGSLMNPKSLARTLPGERIAVASRLRGYRRICNVPVSGYAYLNLEEDEQSSVEGVLIGVNESELVQLKVRERGYECIDVTDVVANIVGRVYVFIATQNCRNDLPVPKSYIRTCTQGMSDDQLKIWIEETAMPGGVFEDLSSPVYANYVP